MTTLMIKDLTESKELDSKAMAAVAGGKLDGDLPDLPVLFLDYTSVSTSFPVKNRSKQYSGQANSVDAFNFGVVDQNNSSDQTSIQLGSILGGAPVPV